MFDENSMFKESDEMFQTDRSCGAMDSALDFGSRGCGFESHLDRFFLFRLERTLE